MGSWSFPVFLPLDLSDSHQLATCELLCGQCAASTASPALESFQRTLFSPRAVPTELSVGEAVTECALTRCFT